MHAAPRDIKLKRAERQLEVTWGDGAVVRYGVRQLRCECGCAGCVDEKTGVRILNLATVPQDVGITQMELVGHYAVKFVFSDGHDTGIYSFRLLRGLCPCDDCGGERR